MAFINPFQEVLDWARDNLIQPPQIPVPDIVVETPDPLNSTPPIIPIPEIKCEGLRGVR